MRKLLWTLLALLPLCAGAQNLATTIKVQAMSMATALMKNDYRSFSRYMHPGVIAAAGGDARMKAKMDSASATMKRVGAGFTHYWIGNPGPIVRHNNELQALVPQRSTVRTPLGMLTVESTLIAISRNEGKDWWFIDCTVYGPQKLKTIIPDLSPQLVIPPRKKPKLEPLQ
ncbi:MAG: hypothetical protein EOO11_04585 [Chitinophagaceae bacterium]|nr:MAG: hypothetical protein EOO11_04585 [Chitinophagaceae bacterium]